MENINCLHPVRILHPSYLSFLLVSDLLVIIDDYNVRNLYNLNSFLKGSFIDGLNFFKAFHLSSKIKYSLDSYFLKSSTGECFPVFMDVPCGHCDACNLKRQNGIIQRLNFGFEEDEKQTLFVTLTYNDKHLPSCGVCRRDIQLFKKRLNKIVSTYGCQLKYGYFSEYGELGRPHYHMIIYGMPLINNLSSYKCFEFYSKMLQFCWRSFPKKGFKRSERYNFSDYLKRNYKWFNVSPSSKNADPYSMGFVNVEFPTDGKCFGYISKYISKSSNVPEGNNKNFYNLSNNLGVKWLSERINNIRSYDSKFLYLSKSGNQPKEIYLTSYYIRKLFPSFSQVVPLEFRRNWISFHYHSLWISENKHLPSWYRLSALNMLENVNKRFPSLCPILDFNVDPLGQYVYAITFDRSTWCDVVTDDFLSDYIRSYKYLMSFSADFENFVSESIFKRDSFLRNYNKFHSDPLITALKFSKTFNKYQSSKKL